MGERGPKKGEGGRPRKKQGTTHSEGYTRVTVGPKGKGHQEYKHRVVKGLKKGDGKVVDHKDRNRGNNAKGNLETTTQSKNAAKSNRRRGRKG